MNTTLESVLTRISAKLEQNTPLDDDELEALRKYPVIVENLRQKNPIQMGALDFGIPILLYKMSANYVGKYVSFDADIVGNDSGMARVKIGVYNCTFCDYTQKFPINNGEIPALCPECKRRSLKFNENESELTDFSILYVRELPDNVDTQDIDDYQAFMATNWVVNYRGLPPTALSVRISGYVRARKKSRNEEMRLEFDADVIKPIEDIKSGRFTLEDIKNIKDILKTKEDRVKFYNTQIAPLIKGRDFAKEAALCVIFSLTEIPDITDDKIIIRGSINAAFIGDTKTGKSDVGKDIPMNYKFGDYVDAANLTRTGLTYGIDNDNKIIIWGVLPQNDKKMVVIDDINQLDKDEMKRLRETLEQQEVIVNRSIKGRRKARVRILAMLNPNSDKPMDSSYSYKIQAFQDTYVFRYQPDITRWDIFIPFTESDVSKEEIAEAQSVEPIIAKDLFARWVKFVWNLKAGQVKYQGGVKEKIIHHTKALLNEYSNSPYPIIHNGYREVLTRISVAYACMGLSFSEELNSVLILPEHVDIAYEFIDKMLWLLGYGGFVRALHNEIAITPIELERVWNGIDGTDKSILKELALHLTERHTSQSLADKFGVGIATIKRHYDTLQEFGLIETSHGLGVKIKAKGNLVVKHILKVEEGQITTQGQQDITHSVG